MLLSAIILLEGHTAFSFAVLVGFPQNPLTLSGQHSQSNLHAIWAVVASLPQSEKLCQLVSPLNCDPERREGAGHSHPNSHESLAESCSKDTHFLRHRFSISNLFWT